MKKEKQGGDMRQLLKNLKVDKFMSDFRSIMTKM